MCCQENRFKTTKENTHVGGIWGQIRALWLKDRV
ncbi:hypothetical protein T4C_3447 [Trichinella pseudospiralis]|uniref:Uncharacterized protein n=1 Tax=Trichinella pseudospiralis TaxID=6337 RepID=A0A0V1G8G4_TRIPS|nr:hypothetical protein T4C_3447 [Trichinella pseudospiralis]